MNPMINKCFNILLEVLNFTRTKHRDFDCIVAKAKANQQELHLWSGVVRFRKEMVHLPWYKIIGTILRDMIFQSSCLSIPPCLPFTNLSSVTELLMTLPWTH
ncbi:uncharacterized protein LOC111781410 isoform X4 [Cucurbita pepo subsp. pepo]|uniref:uncharacterized protein LOC111781410 isoform X4 n=1 Tax=Cucurbita pepo subsp. pepo TaxID=3664 RepID=UPI000C9D8914|nr:uncharacterized protein LOC111781410 isoform X4 [Cucurbita pepo subsp. pepo]